nr:uncharacterized protein LOC119170529 isoform X2 [Rhipicephalus microplus]
MRSFVAYPAATLLVLLAVIETGLCRKALPCPAHCSASLTVFMPDGSTTSVHGSKAVEVIRFKEEISRASWKHLVVIKVANTKIRVPPSLETMIRLVVKKYPDLGQVLIQIIMGEAKNQQKYTYMKGPNKNVGTTTKTRTITKRVTTRKQTKRIPPKPNTLKTTKVTKKTTKKVLTTTKVTKKTTRKPTARKVLTTKKVTKKTTPKPTTKKVLTTTKVTKKTTRKPTARKVLTTKKVTKKATPKPTAKKVLTTTKVTKKMTPKPTTKRKKLTTTTRKFMKRSTPKPAAKKTTVKTTTTTKRVPQTQTKKPPTVSSVPSITMPNPIDPGNTIPAGSGVDSKVLIMLGYMLSQPNYFAAIYRVLLTLGITFPSFTSPINQVMYGTHVIMLPRPFVVSYTYTINNRVFNLPRDAKKLAIYVSQHMNQFSIVAKFLTQLGASFPVDGTGRIIGFNVFNVMYRFPHAITTTIFIGSKRFALPRDISLLLTAIKHNPTMFFELQMTLEAFGVKFIKTGAGSTQAVYSGKKYDVFTGRAVTITIDNRKYDIPAELEKIFQEPKGFSVGSLLVALQEKGIPVNVDEKTGVILGITIDKVQVPFPVSIDLRFKLDNKVYVIPRDLAKLITVLENKGMPSKILSLLYTRYGVVPVRDSNGIVIAISFNGKQYKVKPEPLTAVVILGQKFMLPRDVRKMIEFVHSKQSNPKIGFSFLKALKTAGYMLINDDDGAMRSIQKGAQIIKLGMEIRIQVIYGTTTYQVPKDLMRLVKDVRSLGPKEVKDVIDQLKAFDVQVTKNGSKLTILFNSVRYEVDLKSGSVKG